MTDSQSGPGDGVVEEQQLNRVREGLRMSAPPDPAKLAAEKAHLVELEGLGGFQRFRAYMKLAGPGYLQSAMTLGGGTAISALFAGAAFGYTLLWVAPVAMVIGIVMLSAVSYQTLSTGMRPFEAMRRYAGAPFAWGWAFGALASSIIWHFPQYSLASAVLVDMGQVAGIFDTELEGKGTQIAMSFIVLAWALALSFMYGRSDRMVRWYERALKYMVWLIILCFGLVVWKTGVDWEALFRGFFTFEIPEARVTIDGDGTERTTLPVTLIMGGLAAAVGINMVYLYPYSLLARGWGREHRRMARSDLYFGMFIPYLVATSLIMIASANTLHGDFQGQKMSVITAAQSMSSVIGPVWGRVVFGVGVLAMALSSISLHMLCTGFVCSELFGWPVGSWKYRLATLIPVPGVLGPVIWTPEILVWMAVPTTIACGALLPIAYVGFVLLQRKKAYLGDDTPKGVGGKIWFAAMVASTLFFVVFLAWDLWGRIVKWTS